MTTNERKEQMCLLTREAVSVGKIHFSDQVFSTTQSVREVKDQLEGELRNFCVLVEASKNPFGKVKKTCEYATQPIYPYFANPIRVLVSRLRQGRRTQRRFGTLPQTL